MHLHLSLCVAFIFTTPQFFTSHLFITLHHTLKSQMWPHDKMMLVLERKCIFMLEALVLLQPCPTALRARALRSGKTSEISV